MMTLQRLYAVHGYCPAIDTLLLAAGLQCSPWCIKHDDVLKVSLKQGCQCYETYLCCVVQVTRYACMHADLVQLLADED